MYYFLNIQINSWKSCTFQDAGKDVRAVDDGLFGFSDASGQFIARLGLWNHKDEIVKERLFGLSGTQVMIKLYDSEIKSFSSCIVGLISMFKQLTIYI